MDLSNPEEKDLGVWVEGFNPTKQNLYIIKFAIEHGWRDYGLEYWEEMKDLYINSEPTMSDYEDLAWVLDDAVNYLNNELSGGYYFTFKDTNFVLTHEDLELINEEN
jgi:hypothetical protein